MAIVSLITLIIFHIHIISRLIFFPYPELFIYPYLRNIGLVPYAQIFDQHFPGLLFLPVNLGSLGINTVSSMFVLHLVIVVANHLLIYFIAKSLVKDKWLALVANMFYLLWHPYMEGYVLWIDAFMPLMLLPAFYFFVHAKERKRNYYLSAVFLGLALLFKQVVLPLILILSLFILLVSKDIKKAIFFGLITSVPMAVVCLYYLKLGIFEDFFYWTITFNLTTFAQMGRKYASFTEIIKMIAIFLPGILYLLIKLRERSVIIISIFLFGSLLFAYARFDFIHSQPSLVFLAIIMSMLVSSVPNIFRKNLVILYLLLTLIPINMRLNELKGKKVMFFTDQESQLTSKVKEIVNDGDTIFAFGTTPQIYYLTNTRPPGDKFVFNFPWFFTEAENKILLGIRESEPRVVLRNPTATTQGMNLVEYAPNIDEYIRQNYTLQSKIGDTEILIPNENNSN